MVLIAVICAICGLFRQNLSADPDVLQHGGHSHVLPGLRDGTVSTDEVLQSLWGSTRSVKREHRNQNRDRKTAGQLSGRPFLDYGIWPRLHLRRHGGAPKVQLQPGSDNRLHGPQLSCLSHQFRPEFLGLSSNKQAK